MSKKQKTAPGKNQIRPNMEEETKRSSRKPSRKTSKRKSTKSKLKLPKLEFNVFKNIAGVLDGSFLTKEVMIKSLPYVFFLVVLAMIYISNNYVAQRRIRSIEKLNKEIKELRNEHISVKSDLMFYTKPSEISKEIEHTGIKEAMEPPKKLIVKPKKENNE